MVVTVYWGKKISFNTQVVECNIRNIQSIREL